MTAKAKKQQLVDGEMLAETIHTGFRKGSDTHFSSLAWNLLHLCPAAIWQAYLDYTTPRAAEVEKWTAKTLLEALGAWARTYDYLRAADHLYAGRKVRDAEGETFDLDTITNWCAVLASLFQSMDRQTAKDMAGWFNYCIETWNATDA